MPLTFYKCSQCKMVRDSYEDAEKCELSHLSPISVKPIEYYFGPYPTRVLLTFPDGKEREYVKED